MIRFLKVLLILALMGGAAFGTQHYVTKDQAQAPAGGAPAAAAGGSGNRGGTAQPSKPLPASVYIVEKRDIPYGVDATGTLLPNESVAIAAELNRRLEKIHAEEGSVVEKGQLLYELDRDDLEAELREMEARRELTLLNESRQKNLLDQRATSKANVDEAITNRRIVEAQIESLKTLLAKTELRAPFAGRIGVRRVSEGALLSPDRTITMLEDTARIKVDFRIPERYAGSVAPGQSFRFRPEGAGAWNEGTITAIEPSIDTVTRSLVIRGIADNTTGTLVGGAFVAVQVPLERLNEGFLIPSEAVVPSPRGNRVFVVENGKAVSRDVELGVRTEEMVQVISGVKEGDAIAITNLLRIRPGSEIAVLNGTGSAAKN